MGFIKDTSNVGGLKSSKGNTTYYVNANTGNDNNNGNTVGTPFATIAKLVTELQRFFWTGDVFIHFQGATLLNTPITLSGIGIDALKGVSLRVGVETATTNYTNILTVTDFSIVNLSINLGDSGKVDFRRINRVNSNSVSNRIKLNNILCTDSPVFNFENIQYLDLTRAIACQGTINVQGTLFFIGPVDYGIIDISNLTFFTAPRNIETVMYAYACPQLNVENNAVSFIGQAYILDSVKLYVSDYYGVNKLVGTLPDEFLGGFVNNLIYDNATDKIINFNNTTSLLTGQNYEEGINELALRNNTERRTITTTSTLLNTSPSIQNVINTTGVVQTLNLPTSPTINKYFFIKNHSTSTGNLLVNSITLAPNNVYAVIWDGAEWMVL
jgi:hypothetical protein